MWAQMWRVLLMVLRFGLFPCCLAALLVFFCRTEPVLTSPDILRSDPNIVCWDSAHVVVLIIGAMVFSVCGIITPLLLLRAMKHTVDARKVCATHDEAGANADDLSADEKAKGTQAFARYDSDDSGLIDQQEMLHLLEEQTGRTKLTKGRSLRHKLKAHFVDESMAEWRAEEMRGWMGLQPGEDVSLESFLRMLARMKRERFASTHDLKCVPTRRVLWSLFLCARLPHHA
jgi:hypothetical protein